MYTNIAIANIIISDSVRLRTEVLKFFRFIYYSMNV